MLCLDALRATRLVVRVAEVREMYCSITRVYSQCNYSFGYFKIEVGSLPNIAGAPCVCGELISEKLYNAVAAFALHLEATSMHNQRDHER